jgi:hypothetical protein
MALTLHYHAYFFDASGKKLELPGSPYPTQNTADAAIAAYETAHAGAGGFYVEERRFDQPASSPTPPPVTPPPIGIFMVSAFTCVAVTGSPATFSATLKNNTTSPVPSPGVGFYGADGKQLGWMSSASLTLAPGASLVLTASSAENKADWTPSATGVVAVTAKPGSAGVDRDQGAFIVNVTVAKPTPPPPPPPPPAGARDQALWPFVSSDPFNTPLGDGCTWTPIRDRGTPYVNRDAYSIPIYFAQASDGPKTFNASGGSYPGNNTIPNFPANAQSAAGTDKHLCIISPDRRYSYEMWACDVGAGQSGTFMRVDLRGPGVGLGWCRATGVSVIAGLIRKDELAAGVIPHALAMAGSQGWTGAGGQPWPAISNDDGFSGEGSWLGIPRSTQMPTGMSKGAQAIFVALQTYGGMNVDIAGANVPVLYVEVGTPDSVMPGDISKLAGLIQRVTNYGQSAVGGPGTRVGPIAPGFG